MIQETVKEQLRTLQTAIQQSDGKTIGEALGKLDQLTRERIRELDPQLVHFLQRRSYDKALAFLEGESDIPAGICGGVKKRGEKRRIDVTGGGGDLAQNPFGNLESGAFPQGEASPAEVPQAKKSSKPRNRGRIEIRREKAGRGGKTVTTATGFSGVAPVEQEKWVRELKRRCGVGGTSRSGMIEIQGDRRNDLMEFFAEKGFRPVLAGG